MLITGTLCLLELASEKAPIYVELFLLVSKKPVKTFIESWQCAP